MFLLFTDIHCGGIVVFSNTVMLYTLNVLQQTDKKNLYELYMLVKMLH